MVRLTLRDFRTITSCAVLVPNPVLQAVNHPLGDTLGNLIWVTRPRTDREDT